MKYCCCCDVWAARGKTWEIGGFSRNQPFLSCLYSLRAGIRMSCQFLECMQTSVGFWSSAWQHRQKNEIWIHSNQSRIGLKEPRQFHHPTCFSSRTRSLSKLGKERLDWFRLVISDGWSVLYKTQFHVFAEFLFPSVSNFKLREVKGSGIIGGLPFPLPSLSNLLNHFKYSTISSNTLKCFTQDLHQRLLSTISKT